jgi:hypothetical protein
LLLSKRAKFLQSTFNGDPYESAYQEGMRALFLQILDQIEADPAMMMEKIRKQREQEKRYEI